MKFIVLIFIIPYLLYSCKPNGKTIVSTIETVAQSDTLIHGERYVLYGQDSAICVLRGNNECKIIYTTAIPDGGIHHKSYNAAGTLCEIAYSRHIPLAFDSTDYSGGYYVMYPYPDSVVQYYDNGMVRRSGYAKYHQENYRLAINRLWIRYSDYDSTGILTDKATSTLPGSVSDWIYESFHPNGRLKEKRIQGDVYVSGASLAATEWDSFGNKIKEYKYDYKMPDWGTSYNDRFCVETITEYYPNGKIKQISKTKSFVESDECPCGQWVYFDENGRKVRTEQYKPCNNFLLDCERE